MRSNKGHNLTFKIGDYFGRKVKDIKIGLFGEEMFDSSQIRFIMNGRLLNDEDEVTMLKVDNKTNIQAFISAKVKPSEDEVKKEERANPETDKLKDKKEEGDKPTNIQDALNGQRGFDYFKINGYTDQEIIWKRYIFHSDFILTMPLAIINDDQLFLKEECFLLENPKFIKKPELFKFCEFKPEFNEVLTFKTKAVRTFYFLLGLAIGIPWMLMCYGMNIAEDRRAALVIGTIIQSLLIVVFLIPLAV